MGTQRALSGTQWHLVALSGTQGHAVAPSGTQRALRGTQWHSAALSGTQRHSAALSGTQRPSEALREGMSGTQTRNQVRLRRQSDETQKTIR